MVVTMVTLRPSRHRFYRRKPRGVNRLCKMRVAAVPTEMLHESFSDPDKSRAPHTSIRKIWLPLMVQVYHLQKVHPDKPRQSFRDVFGLISRPYRIIITL